MQNSQRTGKELLEIRLVIAEKYCQKNASLKLREFSQKYSEKERDNSTGKIRKLD